VKERKIGGCNGKRNRRRTENLREPRVQIESELTAMSSIFDDDEWRHFRSDLSALNALRFDRKRLPKNCPSQVEKPGIHSVLGIDQTEMLSQNSLSRGSKVEGIDIETEYDLHQISSKNGCLHTSS
jgi:hypothetical protein